MAVWNRDFLLEFIELYRDQECLWKMTSKDYYNRQKRNASYKMLVDKVKTIDPHADQSLVTRKINNLRSAFRKEMKKSARKVCEMGAEEEYTPKLWYYDHLLFLTDEELPVMTTITENEDYNVDDDMGESPTSPPPSTSSELSCTQSERPKTPTRRPSTSVSCNTLIPNQYKRQKRLEDNLLLNIGERLADVKQEDQFDIFGKHIVTKLRSLPRDQRIYAEKIINDALFEAELGTLRRYSHIVSDEPQLNHM